MSIGNFASAQTIPDWIKHNAGWWAKGEIGDKDFVSGIQYLMERGYMTIPDTGESFSGYGSQEIPSWIKNNAGWWAQGLISDADFVQGIQYLMGKGIITVEPSAKLIYSKAQQIHSNVLNLATSYLTNKDSPSIYALSSASNVPDTTTLLPQESADELISQLQNSIDNLNNDQTATACNQLDSFIAQVTAYVNDGKLTPAEGQPLIDVAQALKDAAAC